ncbi:MAG: isoprenylcysteine carboxylmethyltransferase family protein [Anaerolineaceae bacterium]|nr:isoprenylcysteine carboxylmethyltransferase family protein [Anaerolineaceae bacterium]
MESPKKLLSLRILIQAVFFIIVVPFLPLLISQKWGWWEGWVYGLLGITSFVISRVLAAKSHPDLIAERARFMQHADAQSWDKKIIPLMGLAGFLIVVVVGLDALLGWTPAFDLPVRLLALVLIVAGYAISSCALIENRFFSGNVRLQTERGHTVVSSGPYGWMRHPGYAGALLSYLVTPLFLNSVWAYIPTFLTIGLYVLRTALEDQFLQENLEGYQEYAGQVRYRLLPGIW